MATVEQRKLTRLQDMISDLRLALSDLEDEIDELGIQPDTDAEIADNVTLNCETAGFEWSFTKLEAAQAFDFLDQIGLDTRRRYSLVTVEEIRLAVERILR